MKNTIYLVANGNGYYKVGFTRDLDRRMDDYFSYNPSTKLISTLNTYTKTYMQVETAFHHEIEALGYTWFCSDTGKETEWFYPDRQTAKKLRRKGLAYFKVAKNRSVTVF